MKAEPQIIKRRDRSNLSKNLQEEINEARLGSSSGSIVSIFGTITTFFAILWGEIFHESSKALMIALTLFIFIGGTSMVLYYETKKQRLLKQLRAYKSQV